MSQSPKPSDLAAELADFHRPAYRDWRWLETCWFSAFIPEQGMRVHLRAAFRSNLDVVQTMVAIYSRSGSVLDMDFYDSQVHQPVGTSRYCDFTLPSGLTVRGDPVRGTYTVQFRSRCRRVTIDLQYRALMTPVDLRFTAIPTTEEGFAAFHRPPRGDVSIGHVDQTFHVVGTVELDGETIAVDSVANHDHSWSPRAEFRNGCGTFDEFHFGTDLTLLAHTVQRMPSTADVTHGYLLVDDEVRRIAAASVELDQIGYKTTALKYDVTDQVGTTYVVNAEVVSSVTQDQGSNGLTVMNLCRARWDGRTGVGESMWHWDIPEIQRRVRAARATAGGESLSTEQALARGWERPTA